MKSLSRFARVTVLEPLGYGCADDTERPRTIENIVEEPETTIVGNIEVTPETTVIENIVEEPVEEKQNLLSDILADHASVQKIETVE